jgi:hypothetical protein
MASLPLWVQRHIDTTILPQKSRYTQKCAGHFHHVAMIFRGRNLIAIGQNKTRTKSKRIHSIHAEADVLKTVGDTAKLRGALLVVIRIAPSGLLNSKPCKSCEGLLQKCVREYGMRGWIHS